MITNMDTGTTIGAYHGAGSTPSSAAGSAAPAAVSSSGDADSSGGLVTVDPAANQSQVDSSGSDIEIVGQETWEPEPEPEPSPTYRTVISACNIRSYPDYGDNVIGGLGGGETVLFYGEEAGWYKIEYNGIVGYIGPRFLQ